MRKKKHFWIINFIILTAAYIILSNTFEKKINWRILYRNNQPRYDLTYNYRSSHNTHSLNFDVNGNKIIVILHIQKTGGSTFERRLVTLLDVNPKCQKQQQLKRYNCLNNNGHVWIVSGQYSLKWPCGLHADYTEFTECIDRYFDVIEHTHRERSFLYVTVLRDPIQRYLSEWKHVQRGATWPRYKGKEMRCNHKIVTQKELPRCFKTGNWANVPLDDFMDCPHNLAINRQTRMLANLSLVHCYNTSAMSKLERDQTMLESAKNNLRDMAFFGLTEYQELTQSLFAYTFGMNFTERFSQRKKTYAEQATSDISSSQLARIKELNQLDIELYNYAKELFFRRIKSYNLNHNDKHLKVELDLE